MTDLLVLLCTSEQSNAVIWQNVFEHFHQRQHWQLTDCHWDVAIADVHERPQRLQFTNLQQSSAIIRNTKIHICNKSKPVSTIL